MITSVSWVIIPPTSLNLNLNLDAAYTHTHTHTDTPSPWIRRMVFSTSHSFSSSFYFENFKQIANRKITNSTMNTIYYSFRFINWIPPFAFSLFNFLFLAEPFRVNYRHWHFIPKYVSMYFLRTRTFLLHGIRLSLRKFNGNALVESDTQSILKYFHLSQQYPL